MKKDKEKNKYALNYNKVLFILFFGTVVSLFFVYFKVDDTNRIYDPVWNMLMGIFISSIFYLIVILIPTHMRKNNLKEVFLSYYDQFKEDVLREILHVTEYRGDNVDEKIRQLKNVKNFAKYCKEPSGRREQKRLDVLINNIDKEEYRHSLETIVIKIAELRREIDFMVKTAGVENRDLLQKFRGLDRALQDGRSTNKLDWNLEEDKRFVGLLYEILSGWNFIEGTHKDFIEEWVRSDVGFINNKVYKYIIPALFLVLAVISGFIFYWHDIRPEQVKTACEEEAKVQAINAVKEEAEKQRAQLNERQEALSEYDEYIDEDGTRTGLVQKEDGTLVFPPGQGYIDQVEAMEKMAEEGEYHETQYELYYTQCLHERGLK